MKEHSGSKVLVDSTYTIAVISISSKRKLEQSKKRYEKENGEKQAKVVEEQKQCANDEELQPPSPNVYAHLLVDLSMKRTNVVGA